MIMENRVQRFKKALFLDRDGVINEERNYVYRRQDFILIDGVIDAVRLAKDYGYAIAVVSNQAGIARGYYGVEDVRALHEHMLQLFLEAGASIDAIYFCPHHPDGIVRDYAVKCYCRKPYPGMISRAAAELEINLWESVLVGDKLSDIQAGVSAGVGKNCLVGVQPEDSIPTGKLKYLRYANLRQAVAHCCTADSLAG